MKIDEIRENKMNPLSYEQPSLKKYGTMKEFTLGSGGSGGDGMGPEQCTTVFAVPANDTPNQGTCLGPDKGDPNSTFD